MSGRWPEVERDRLERIFSGFERSLVEQALGELRERLLGPAGVLTEIPSEDRPTRPESDDAIDLLLHDVRTRVWQLFWERE